jgi:hypothetical protein
MFWVRGGDVITFNGVPGGIRTRDPLLNKYFRITYCLVYNAGEK